MTEPRRVKFAEIEAMRREQRRRRGFPDRPSGSHWTPAELDALLRAQRDRLDQLSRLFREVFPPNPDRVP